ncbi:VanZ family protein [Halostagnicola bangensis]
MSLRVPLLPEPIRWLPAGVVAGLIWYWSLVTAPPASLALEMAVLAHIPLETMTTAGQPLEGGPIAGTRAATASGFSVSSEWISRGAARHAVAYATLALCLVYALAGRGGSLARTVVIAFVLATGYGIAMEVGQLFQPDRVASLADVVINALGATAALSWYGLERRVTFVPLAEFRRESRQPA